MTLDHDWLQQNLERVTVGGVDDGTAIGSAIAASVNRLRMTQAKSKVIILLTDGVNNTGKISPLAAAEAARAWALRYTPSASAYGEMRRFPVATMPGNTRIVMAQVDVDEKTLQAVAHETGGSFIAQPIPVPCKTSTSKSIASRKPLKRCRNSSIRRSCILGR